MIKKSVASIDNIYKIDGKVPLARAIPFGLQHVLAMFVANIAPILIVSEACGLAFADSHGYQLYLRFRLLLRRTEAFSQKVGLIAMTGVVNRMTVATGACVMILAGIFPAVGAVLATLPESVPGGCTIMMFGTIVISGLQMLSKCGFAQRNITIAALSLGVGLGFTQVPEMFSLFPDIVRTVFGENCVAVVFIVSIVLDLLMPKDAQASDN